MKPIMQKLGVTVAMIAIYLSAFASASTAASTYDFEVGGIYYKITDAAAKEVEVTTESLDSYSGEIVVPSSVTYNGEDYSVTSIWKNAFVWCGNLTAITIPNTVTAIGENTFNGCRNLTSIEIPNTVTTIGNQAFTGCASLTTITIPGSVTTIGENVFAYCRNLTTIVIPNSVTTIGKEAFFRCSSLRSITSLAVTPPECGDSVFDKIDKQKCVLYVPTGSVEAYRQAPGWKDFDIVEEAETGIDSIEAVSAAAATEVFNLAGEKVAATTESLPAGIYIVREGLTVRKIVVR